MAKSSATLTDNETGKTYEMPIIHGTIGPRLVDVRKFYGDSGMFTYDPGFTSTGSCESKITYIDGDEGVLLYRCLLYTSPSPRDGLLSRMPSSA